MTRTVSTIVVTFNHADEIVDCLNGVAQNSAPPYEIQTIVVDNASADATVARAQSHTLRPLVIAQDENTGFAAGVNAGAAAANGDWLLLLNPDCVMEAGCVDALVRHLQDHPSAALAAATLLNPDGSVQLFARRELTVLDVALSLTYFGRLVDRRLLAGWFLRRRTYANQMAARESVLSVDCAAAACVLIRRTDAAVPLLDERYPLLFNDAVLARQLRERGSIDIIPSARAVHGYGTSLRRADSAGVRAEFVKSLRDYYAHWPTWRRAALTAVLGLDALTAFAAAKARGASDALDHARGTAGGLGVGSVSPLFSRRRA